ncbi:hypothetical protein MWU57_05700 [Isoptericola sp. S6320L]|uniref:hypothetical protein n=1 Tax=Isoptericola sp. S6320L TaxID=2926411 RepID=UPI001FF17689|nr:hypothetical protein [Isoptericola sp. S6320L]MCK0116518.1 hypothetical protein [Isoptericola sp. S6320L]
MARDIEDAQRAGPAGAEVTVTPARRALRPLGYLLVGLVWTALSVLVLALGPGILVFVALDGTMEVGGLWGDLTAQPGEMTAFALSVPLLVAIWGPGVLWYLPCATWPLAALSFVYVGRSLRPRHAAEPLSRTQRVGRGNALGLPTASGVALSLQPVHPSRTTRSLMRWYASGWLPDGHMFVATLPAGGAWLLTLVGLASDVPVPARTALLVSAACLAVWSVVLGRRAWRRRFYGVGPGDGPDVAPTSLSPEERRARIAELRARRDARARVGPLG